MARQQESVTVRPDELGRLLSIIEVAVTGGFAAAELTGGPGTGKTLLLTECFREAYRQGMRVLRATCSEAQQPVPFQPLVRALSSWSVAGAPPAVNALAERLARGGAEPGGITGTSRHIAGIRGVLRECLADAPHGMLLVLDDCQWADAATVELLQSLVRSPVPGGLALLVAHRPSQAPAELLAALREGRVAAVTLPALTVRQSAALLGAAPEDPELVRLHWRSEGNPRRLTALAYLQSADDPGDVWDRDGLGAKIAAETASLDHRAWLVARAAAVLDDAIDADAVAAVAEIPRGDACAGLGELRRRELILAAGPGVHTFRDPLLRLWLYSSADPCWRSEAHQRALDYLTGKGAPATELAPHVTRVDSPGARRILTAAASSAAESGRAADAARWLSAALRFRRAADAPGRERIGARQWRPVLRALAATGDSRRVAALGRDVLTAAEPDAGHAPDRLPVVLAFSCALAALGRGDDAEAMVNAELGRHAVADPDMTATLRIHRQLVRVLNGQIPERAEVAMPAAALPNPLAAGLPALTGLAALADGDIRGAVDALTRSAATFDRTVRDRAPDDTECAYLIVLSWAEALIGRYRAAAGHAERALAAVRDRGDAHVMAPLLNTLAYVRYQSGRAADALGDSREAGAYARGTGRADHGNLAAAITAAAWAQLARTGADPARHPGRTPPHTTLSALLLAESYLAAGDHRAALALLQPRRDAPWVLEPVPVLAPRGYELLAAAACESGIRPEIIAGWAAQAAEAAAAIGLPEPEGHALLARGHMLMSRRLPGEAARCYQRAHELLGDGGPAGARARDLARRTATSAPGDPLGSLTSREREVARLAGGGRRSKEIAEQLRVSRRTVEAHLGRVYHKLGVTSRAELAVLVTQAD